MWKVIKLDRLQIVGSTEEISNVLAYKERISQCPGRGGGFHKGHEQLIMNKLFE